MTDGRLPKPKGKPTREVDRALVIYRRLFADGDQRKMSLRRVTLLGAILNAKISIMTKEELAHYYKGAADIRNAL